MVEWGITEGDVLSRLISGRRRSRYFSCRIELWQHQPFPGSNPYKTCVGGPWIEGEKYHDILDVLGVALLRKNCMKLWRTEPVSLEVTEDSTILCLLLSFVTDDFTFYFFVDVRVHKLTLFFHVLWFVSSPSRKTTTKTTAITMCSCIPLTPCLCVHNAPCDDWCPLCPLCLCPGSQLFPPSLPFHLCFLCYVFSSGPLLRKTIPSETPSASSRLQKHLADFSLNRVEPSLFFFYKRGSSSRFV